MKKIIKKTTNSAVVGIVTAMLLIGLIVTVISIFQLVYVPIIMEQREAEHMDRVAEQFGFITSVIDNQAADGRKGIPIAAFVTLGSKELPFLVSSKAYGTLEILKNSCTININNSINPYRIGTIKYSSTNVYYLDQSYTYEAGAMIVSQSSGNKTLVRPNFIVDYNKTSNIVNISFDVINISSVGQKTIAAGSGTCGIQTEFRDISTNISFTDVSNMTITTSFSNAWFVFINQSLMEAGLNLNQFNLNKMGQDVKLNFKSTLTVNIIFKIIEIQAQIGPGWIE
ncbi:MAG: hypothetical protein MUO82_11620 [Candidatus Thermoplasmatota archaeon]|nr:hypothetical protein [Candidatus Thermoplasmatota archaeon]